MKNNKKVIALTLGLILLGGGMTNTVLAMETGGATMNKPTAWKEAAKKFQNIWLELDKLTGQNTTTSSIFTDAYQRILDGGKLVSIDMYCNIRQYWNDVHNKMPRGDARKPNVQNLIDEQLGKLLKNIIEHNILNSRK